MHEAPSTSSSPRNGYTQSSVMLLEQAVSLLAFVECYSRGAATTFVGVINVASRFVLQGEKVTATLLDKVSTLLPEFFQPVF